MLPLVICRGIKGRDHWSQNTGLVKFISPVDLVLGIIDCIFLCENFGHSVLHYYQYLFVLPKIDCLKIKVACKNDLQNLLLWNRVRKQELWKNSDVCWLIGMVGDCVTAHQILLIGRVLSKLHHHIKVLIFIKYSFVGKIIRQVENQQTVFDNDMLFSCKFTRYVLKA